jgi:quinoprotein glucose dehydrogenase
LTLISLRVLAASLGAAFVMTSMGGAQTTTAGGGWPVYGGDRASSRYSPLDQIHRGNVARLEIAWRWRSPDNDVPAVRNAAFEATPLALDGVLYTSTSGSQVAAIDGETGQTRWRYDPRSYDAGRPSNNGFLHRGVATWTDGDGGPRRIFIATGDARLIALHAATGLPIAGFGAGGAVDLRAGIPRLDGRHIQYGMTSPPAICGDVVVVGSSIHDGEISPPSPPGDVRGFDARSGRLLWTFHTVPRAGEPGVETWEDESWRQNGAANVWAPMSVDDEHGRVYLPVSCPTNNYYGGRRPGDNLYANSVVALDCATGQRIWHFQTVHHDIWDYDLPAAPNLVDLVVDGRPIEAVAQVTKLGFVFVLDRATGEPLWPIDEVAVPPSTVPGERAAPTQPIPTRPPPFERQGVSIDELNDATPQVHAAAVDIISRYDWGGLFEPPSLRGAIVNPGIGGGANWGGASFDPETGMLYVPSVGSLPFLARMQSAGPADLWYAEPTILTGPPGHFNLFKPPFGTITAYDLGRGEIRWRVPNNGGNGVVGQSSTLLTKTLLFFETRSEPKLAAFDKATGERLWEIGLPANASGAPMTYLAGGLQHVVVAVGVGDQPTELVALRLPRGAVGSAGTVRFASAASTVAESAGAATLAVVRQGGRAGEVTVEVATVGGTGTPGADFDGAAHTLQWGDDEGGAKPVSIPIVADGLEEGDETVTLALRDPTGGLALGAPSNAALTIADDDVDPCVADAHTLCLVDGRFRVRASFRTAKPLTGQGLASPLTEDSGYFTFFAEENVEVLVKVHDACVAPFDRYWVFAAGLTNVEVTLTVADTERDVVRRYDNPLGRAFPPIQDTSAFATCP